MNKKIKKAVTALSLCAAMVAASFCSICTAQAQTEQPPIQVPEKRRPIALNTGSVQIETGGKYQILVQSKADADAAEWFSSNKQVAKVTQKGRIESIGVGTATITAKIGKYRRGYCKVTVVPSGTIGNAFSGYWQSDYCPDGLELSAYDLKEPINNLLKYDISVEKFKGYSFVRSAAYVNVNGVSMIHTQARKGGKRMSVFLKLRNEGMRQVLDFEYASGSNPDLRVGGYSQSYYAYR